MPSCDTYHLTWFTLTWTWGISSWLLHKVQLLLLTLDEGYLLMATPPDLECGVTPLGPPVPTQPVLLGCGVVPLSRCPWSLVWVSSCRLLPLTSDLG